MTDKSNIEDVTNSSKDWEDFWNMDEEQALQELMKPRSDIAMNSYIQDVLDGKNTICKRESPLSE
jgi:hypothetical protein